MGSRRTRHDEESLFPPPMPVEMHDMPLHSRRIRIPEPLIHPVSVGICDTPRPPPCVRRVDPTVYFRNNLENESALM